MRADWSDLRDLTLRRYQKTHKVWLAHASQVYGRGAGGVKPLALGRLRVIIVEVLLWRLFTILQIALDDILLRDKEMTSPSFRRHRQFNPEQTTSTSSPYIHPGPTTDRVPGFWVRSREGNLYFSILNSLFPIDNNSR